MCIYQKDKIRISPNKSLNVDKTNQEKKETLDNMLICYVDRTDLTNKQIEETEIFVEELILDINYKPELFKEVDLSGVEFSIFENDRWVKI